MFYPILSLYLRLTLTPRLSQAGVILSISIPRVLEREIPIFLLISGERGVGA